jgi:hypothetical protein
VVDDARSIDNVGSRQNQQSYDADQWAPDTDRIWVWIQRSF